MMRRIPVLTGLLLAASIAHAEPPASALGDPISPDRLLEALYGDGLWTIYDEAPEDGGRSMHGKGAAVTPLLAERFTEARTEKLLLVTWILPPGFDCHACRGFLGAALYRRRGPSWEPQAVARAFLRTGHSGVPPRVGFRQFGPDSFGFALEVDDSSQDESFATLSLYRAHDRRFVPLLDEVVLHRFDQIAKETCLEKRVTFSIEESSVSGGLFDLRALLMLGTRGLADAGSPQPRQHLFSACNVPLERAPNLQRFDLRYHFDGDRYCVVGSAPRLGDSIVSGLSTPSCGSSR